MNQFQDDLGPGLTEAEETTLRLLDEMSSRYGDASFPESYRKAFLQACKSERRSVLRRARDLPTEVRAFHHRQTQKKMSELTKTATGRKAVPEAEKNLLRLMRKWIAIPTHPLPLGMLVDAMVTHEIGARLNQKELLEKQRASRAAAKESAA